MILSVVEFHVHMVYSNTEIEFCVLQSSVIQLDTGILLMLKREYTGW